MRVPGHWGLPLFRAFKARGRGCLQSLKAYQCDSDSPFPGTFLGDVQKPPVKARNQVKRDCLCASWMTQICLSWSALSLGLPLLLTLSSLPGVPSPPSISKTHHQASLTDSLTQPARCYHGRSLLQSLTHARPLVIQRRNWLFSGLYAPRGQGPRLVPFCFSWCPHGPGPRLAQSWQWHTSHKEENE